MEQQIVTIVKYYQWKSSQYVSKRILKHYHYLLDTKLCPGIDVIRRITYSFHACAKIVYLPWDSTNKEAFNQPRYGRVYHFKYSLNICYHNNWIMMSFLDDGTDEVQYIHINKTKLYGNVMSMYLIIMVVQQGDIYADDSMCHGYYIIIFYLSIYTLQADLIKDIQVVSSGEMVTYFQ